MKPPFLKHSDGRWWMYYEYSNISNTSNTGKLYMFSDQIIQAVGKDSALQSIKDLYNLSKEDDAIMEFHLCDDRYIGHWYISLTFKDPGLEAQFILRNKS